MRGRRPKPTALKIREGNPGKRPLNQNEPTPQTLAPSRPSHLAGEAKKEWDRIVPELLELGLLSRVDRVALACYCESWGLYLKALAKLRKDGEVTTTANGNSVQSPWMGIANTQKKLAHKFLVEFGLTPSTRSRLSVKDGPVKSKADELQDFMRIAR